MGDTLAKARSGRLPEDGDGDPVVMLWSGLEEFYFQLDKANDLLYDRPIR